MVIVNDGTDVFLSDELINSYPFKIEYYKESHVGVSETRNRCLDHSVADYVMFCDADDMFYSVNAFWIIFREIDKHHFDTMVSNFIEEGCINGDMVYLNHKDDHTFVHGKVHRRGYLFENQIRWQKDLTIHEDSYFNIMTWELTSSRLYYPEPYYLWKYRKESVCRSDPQYILKTYDQLIKTIDRLVSDFNDRGMREKAVFHTCYGIIKTYYELNLPRWRDEANLQYKEKVEKAIYDFGVRHAKEWDEGTLKIKQDIANDQRNTAVKSGMLFEELTLNQWLSKIIEKYRKNDN